jgi:hypothetical protein
MVNTLTANAYLKFSYEHSKYRQRIIVGALLSAATGVASRAWSTLLGGSWTSLFNIHLRTLPL